MFAKNPRYRHRHKTTPQPQQVPTNITPVNTDDNNIALPPSTTFFHPPTPVDISNEIDRIISTFKHIDDDEDEGQSTSVIDDGVYSERPDNIEVNDDVATDNVENENNIEEVNEVKEVEEVEEVEDDEDEYNVEDEGEDEGEDDYDESEVGDEEVQELIEGPIEYYAEIAEPKVVQMYCDDSHYLTINMGVVDGYKIIKWDNIHFLLSNPTKKLTFTKLPAYYRPKKNITISLEDYGLKELKIGSNGNITITDSMDSISYDIPITQVSF